MTTNKKQNTEVHVTCEVCIKEVPSSIATIPEGTDYVVYFCGLECYEKWKNQAAKPDNQAVYQVS